MKAQGFTVYNFFIFRYNININFAGMQLYLRSVSHMHPCPRIIQHCNTNTSCPLSCVLLFAAAAAATSEHRRLSVAPTFKQWWGSRSGVRTDDVSGGCWHWPTTRALHGPRHRIWDLMSIDEPDFPGCVIESCRRGLVTP